jgi:hypothetical protein
VTYVDLHLHTHHSDGSDSPAEVIRRARELGIAAAAITDHDTVSGVEEARQAAAQAGLGFLAGTEISAHFESSEVHVVGLGIDPDCPALLGTLEQLQKDRNTRAEKIIARLQERGLRIEWAMALEYAGGGVVARMHIARALRALGITRSTQEGFDRFLNSGRPGYVPKATLPVAQAIDTIHAAGGLAFVGHPGLGKTTRRLLPRLLALPFDGVEAYHSSHSPGRIAEFVEFAQAHHLLITGGSDCHGVSKGRRDMGSVRTPVEYYERIVEALAKRATRAGKEPRP